MTQDRLKGIDDYWKDKLAEVNCSDHMNTLQIKLNYPPVVKYEIFRKI